jgi:sulfatase maturation enzyme AslB (radical SAM superfamily)
MSILATHLSFYFLFIFLKKIEVIIHEIPSLFSSKLDSAFEKTKWALCPKLIFHTEKEIKYFASRYFKSSSNKYELRAHHADFFKFREVSKNDARKELGIPMDAIVFLCIGFIQPHKGFDRAIQAFSKVNNDNNMVLYVVGSLRVTCGEYVSYLQGLRDMAGEASNIQIIEKYLSDEEFDTWINSCDVIITPYREIWSSGIIARAKLFNKPVIASDVGGLPEQLTDGDVTFKDDDELRYIFREFSKMVKKKQELSDFGIECIFVEITNVCNMHCKFCPSDHIKRKREFMDFDTFKMVIGQLSNLIPPHPIALHAVGEPLLHKDIFKFIDYCNSKKINIYLFTNCTKINENIAQICKRDNIEALVLSLQTPTPDSYKLRGYNRLSFEEYMNGIFDAIGYIIKTKTNERMRVEIHLANTKGIPFSEWNILDTNEDALNVIKALGRRIKYIHQKYYGNNHDEVSFTNLVELDLANIPKNILDLKEWEYWGYEAVKNIYIRLKFLGTFGAPESILPKNVEVVERRGPQSCDMAKTNLCILSDGTITICCLDVEGDLKIGNINECTIHDALRSNKRAECIKDVTKYTLCRRCLGEINAKT